MLRHPALQDLSRDHFVALNHVMRIQRIVENDRFARPLDVEAPRFGFFMGGPMRTHFDEEEQLLVPLLRKVAPEAAARLMQDHEALRAMADRLHSASGLDAWWAFAQRLRSHARWEEQVAFPALQAKLTQAELDHLATRSERFRKAEGMPVGPT